MTPKRDEKQALSQQAASSTDCTGILPNPVDGLESAAMDELMAIYIDPPVTGQDATPADPKHLPLLDGNARPCDAHNPQKTRPSSHPAR